MVVNCASNGNTCNCFALNYINYFRWFVLLHAWNDRAELFSAVCSSKEKKIPADWEKKGFFQLQKKCLDSG